MTEEKKGTAEQKPAKSKTGAAEEAPRLIRAEASKRIAAALMEGIPVYLIACIPFIGGLISALYLAVRDALPLSPAGGQSVGKKLFSLRAVRTPEGAPCDYATSILRNLPFIVPPLLMTMPRIGWFFGSLIWAFVFVLETLLVIVDERGERIGDRIAKTAVVAVQD